MHEKNEQKIRLNGWVDRVKGAILQVCICVSVNKNEKTRNSIANFFALEREWRDTAANEKKVKKKKTRKKSE